MCQSGWAEIAPETYNASFRPGHHLTLFVTFQQNKWNVRQAGVISGVAGRSVSPGLGLRYSFHFNIYRTFGLLVGSGVQFLYENRNYSGFVPKSSFQFPSMIFGIVNNIDLKFRISAFGEYSANWYPMMLSKGEENKNIVLGAIPDHFAFFTQFDFFSRRNIAFSSALGWRRTCTNCVLQSNSSESILNRIHISNDGFFMQSGMTWQLGDELGK